MSKTNLFLRPILDNKVIIFDKFDDSNGVLLSEREIKPINKPKTEWSGNTLVIYENEAISNTESAFEVLNAGIYNTTVELDITLGEGDEIKAGIIGRYLDSNNYWLIQLNLDTNRIELYEINSGSYILRSIS